MFFSSRLVVHFLFHSLLEARQLYFVSHFCKYFLNCKNHAAMCRIFHKSYLLRVSSIISSIFTAVANASLSCFASCYDSSYSAVTKFAGQWTGYGSHSNPFNYNFDGLSAYHPRLPTSERLLAELTCLHSVPCLFIILLTLFLMTCL